MVPRSDYLTLQSEAKAGKEDAESKAKDLEWTEAQLVRAQEQLKVARSEVAQLQVAMTGMVSKSELFVTRAEAEKLREAISELQESTKKLEDEKYDLVQKMQVAIVRVTLFQSQAGYDCCWLPEYVAPI